MGDQDKSLVSLYAVGDVCVNRDDPNNIFALSASAIQEADIAFCQLETMYSERGAPSLLAGVPLRAHPRNISALTFAGFHVASMAGNHVLDWGDDALMDTIEQLERNNIRVVGAGKNLAEARKAVVIERKGVQVAFLAYNSILPRRYWAEANKPGCAPIRAHTAYEPYEHGQPGSPVRILTFANQQDLDAMRADISKAKQSADVVILSLHWGLHFTPAVLAMYQKEVGYAAIDAGADLIIGTHAHILKGIEIYKSKVITYSLCNFAFDLHITAEDFQSPKRKELAKVYPNRQWFPDYPTYPFPIDSRKTILLKCLISKKGIEKVSFLPVFINRQGQPEILHRQDGRSMEVFKYMDELSKEFGTKLSFAGDEVLIHTGEIDAGPVRKGEV
jgi:poly-gamma-glutamate capsule biosynthesis protein CapA/YwtB (metallophosphatase superfamily)